MQVYTPHRDEGSPKFEDLRQVRRDIFFNERPCRRKQWLIFLKEDEQIKSINL